MSKKHWSKSEVLQPSSGTNSDDEADLKKSVPIIDAFQDFKPVTTNRQVNRRATYCFATPGEMEKAASTNSLDGRRSSITQETDAILQSDNTSVAMSLACTKAVEGVENVKEEKPPIPFDVEIKSTLSNRTLDSKQPRPEISKVKNERKSKISPKVIFIVLFTTMLFSITMFLLLFYGLPMGILQGATLYNTL